MRLRILFACLCPLLVAVAPSARAAEAQVRLTPQAIAKLPAVSGRPGSSGLAGVTTTVLAGDPSKAGPYSVRLHVPAHTTIQAHSHRDDRAAVVVSGVWRLGYGRVASPAALTTLPVGSFYTEPAGEPHFAATGDTAVDVIISGFGPTDTTYVDARNAPTH